MPYFSLTYIIVILLLLVVAIWTFLKKCRTAFVICCIFACLINLLSQSIPFTLCHPHDSGAKIRIMSYNINAKCGRYESLQNWQDIIHVIDSVGPDIILPQEFDFYGGEELRKALNVRYPFNCKRKFGKGYYGTDMIFSRYSVLSYEYLLGFPTPVYKLTIDVNGKNINIVNCYLHSNKFSSEVESGEHNYLQRLKEGYDMRKVEVDAIVDSLCNCVDEPLIVCGDMNDVSGSYTIRTLQDSLRLKDAWWQGGTGFGFTYHGYGVLRFRLDHIMFNKYLVLHNVSVPHVGYSDHWPIVADFTIK